MKEPERRWGEKKGNIKGVGTGEVVGCLQLVKEQNKVFRS